MLRRLAVSMLREVGRTLRLAGTASRTAGSVLEFRSRPDDVFVVTYPRSGTTWMQMILYQMLSDGEMSLTHIAERTPFIERWAVRGGAEALDDLGDPRIFKTHLRYAHMRHLVRPHREAKFIYVTRHPADVAASFYEHSRRFHGFTGSFDDFFEEYIAGKVSYGGWKDHVAEWRRNDAGFQVLYVSYEDMKRDLGSVVRRIARFLGRRLNDEEEHRVLERSSFDFMKRHEHLFDHATEILWELGVDLDASPFIREGAVGRGKARLSAHQREQLETTVASLGFDPWESR